MPVNCPRCENPVLPSVGRCDRCSFLSDEVFDHVVNKSAAARRSLRWQGTAGVFGGFVALGAGLVSLWTGLVIGPLPVATGVVLGIAIGAWGARGFERSKLCYHLPGPDDAKLIESELAKQRARALERAGAVGGVETSVAIR